MLTKKVMAVTTGISVAALTVGALSAGALLPHATIQDEPPVTVIPVVTNAGDITLPVDAYVPSAEEVRTMQHGVYVAVAACMERFGVHYDAPPWYQQLSMFPMENGELSHARLYGLFDADQADQTGYHVGPVTQEALEESHQQIDQETQREESHAAAYLNVLGAQFGGGTYAGQTIPDGGCLNAGKLRVRGPAVDLVREYEALMGQSWNAATSDSRVQSAFAAWGECMLHAGYSYQSPWEANNDPRWGTITVSPQEIATAVADVRCKQQTNLVGIYAAVQTAYQLQFLREHSEELDDAVGAFDRAVDTARALLSAR